MNPAGLKGGTSGNQNAMSILYLGDDNVSGAAAYLSGVMLYHGIPFEHIDSTDSPPADWTQTRYDSYILSDYPAQNFRPGQLEQLQSAVADGAGLLMLGGWESYFGQKGEYHQTVLADVLPVTMQNRDDRRNLAQPVLVSKCHDHPILADLPWNRPPFIGGFNRFAAKPGSDVLLKALCYTVEITESAAVSATFTVSEEHPLLVVGSFGQGRTAAFASDVAPHWIGGMVDWGTNRVAQEIPNAGAIEVGENYARFFAQLVRWTCRQG